MKKFYFASVALFVLIVVFLVLLQEDNFGRFSNLETPPPSIRYYDHNTDSIYSEDDLLIITYENMRFGDDIDISIGCQLGLNIYDNSMSNLKVDYYLVDIDTFNFSQEEDSSLLYFNDAVGGFEAITITLPSSY